MTQILPVALGAAADVTAPQQQSSSNASTAANAFGLQFDSLLKIILTQLTYQDPLKPMDNFQFVSQLAQFSQIQQGQASNDKLDVLVSAQAMAQATSLLGSDVDIQPEGSALLTGKVTGVTFTDGAASLIIQTATGAVPGIPVSAVTRIRKGS